MIPELLSPAGNREAMIAAVQNGADAVYLGAGAFNARRSAGNFDTDGLREAVRYCHVRGVKVHVTLNTLVREDELPAFLQTAREVYEAGADAAIVQDFGVARLLKGVAPDLAMHASTQMALHNRQGVEFAAKAGFDRAVLAREMTFSEIAACVGAGIEMEAFAHGALCVACSGQCLFSSMVGGRSGNRGMCAQPCRLEYSFLGKNGCLLSPRDLMALEDLPRLAEAGVCSLKIEGRLKRPEYVAVTTRIYRKALDGELTDLPAAVEELRQMFNRGGFTRGYGPGVSEEELMYPARANNMGVRVGRSQRNGAVLLERDVETQDAMALRRGAEEIPVQLSGRAGETVACAPARRGDALYRTVSEEQMRFARESFSGENRAVRIDGRLRLRVGEPAELEASDGEHAVLAVGETVQRAIKLPVDAERMAGQVKKTGGTAFTWRKLDCDIDGDAFMAASALNALRRDALERLEDARTEMPRRRGECPAAPEEEAGPAGRPVIVAQSADPRTLLAALEAGAEEIAFAPRDLRAEALDAVAERLRGTRFFLVPPPVLPGESLRALNIWVKRQEGAAGVYMTNAAHLGLDWPGERRGGFMLNCMNSQARAFLREQGVGRYSPSIELNAGQIRALPGPVELVVYGRMPLMWLRHCPLRAALSLPGKHADCRRCDACGAGEGLDGRTMRDRRGAEFPLRRIAAEGGCVALLQNCDTLMPLRRAEKLPPAAAWRLLLEDEDDAAAVVRAYKRAAMGESVRDEAIVQMEHTTTGHYFRGVE